MVVESDQDKEHEDLFAYAKTRTTITAASCGFLQACWQSLSSMEGSVSVPNEVQELSIRNRQAGATLATDWSTLATRP